MSKLEELRNYINELFEAATDKSMIQKAAVVTNKLDEAMAEQKAAQDDYNNLFKDYKDAVLHQSYKPESMADTGADNPSVSYFDSNKVFEEIMLNAMDKK